MIESILLNLGLTPEEVDVYQALLAKGNLSAAGVAKASKVKRTYVYKVCEKLVAKGLVTVFKKGATTLFVPQTPEALRAQAEAQKNTAEQAAQALEGVLPSLLGQFSQIEDRPIVTSWTGMLGLKRIYADILREGSDILLLRSIYDDKKPEIDKVVEDQIRAQVEKGIHTRTITPVEKDSKQNFLENDNKRLVERHFATSVKFNLPSQIIVYARKVAIVSLKHEIISTLIDNEDINATFRVLFDLYWSLTSNDHREVVSKWS